MFREHPLHCFHLDHTETSVAAAPWVTREVTETLILRTDEEDGHGQIREPGTAFFIDLVGIRRSQPALRNVQHFTHNNQITTRNISLNRKSFAPRGGTAQRKAI
jgi:hypothetical protein